MDNNCVSKTRPQTNSKDALAVRLQAFPYLFKQEELNNDNTQDAVDNCGAAHENAAGQHEAEQTNNTPEEIAPTPRICPGHERALPVEATVMELDVREEGVCESS